MNSRITLAIIVVFSVITFSMIPLQQQIQRNAFAQDDESDTDTEQRLRQKNTGSGESTNFNCAENMITSASDSIECIPSGPAPPTPRTGAFTIDGTASGTITCNTENDVITFEAIMSMKAEGEDDGTVTGTVNINGVSLPVTGGTTDGNAFSLSGPNGICGLISGNVQAFTVSGNCGTGVTVTYEETDASGTFTGDVECTLA